MWWLRSHFTEQYESFHIKECSLTQSLSMHRIFIVVCVFVYLAAFTIVESIHFIYWPRSFIADQLPTKSIHGVAVSMTKWPMYNVQKLRWCWHSKCVTYFQGFECLCVCTPNITRNDCSFYFIVWYNLNSCHNYLMKTLDLYLAKVVVIGYLLVQRRLAPNSFIQI